MGEKFYADLPRVGPKQQLGTGTGKVPVWPIAGWDPADGQIHVLNLGVLVEPLVQAEKAHILEILDGREEGYDLRTVTIPLGAALNQVFTGQLTVPTGKVWFINAVVMTSPADNGGSPAMNWYCDLWTDRVGASTYGQPFHAADVNFTPGGGAQPDEFHPAALWFGVFNNKSEVLRLPAGKKITFVVTNTLGVALGAMACTLQLYGWEGKKILV